MKIKAGSFYAWRILRKVAGPGLEAALLRGCEDNMSPSGYYSLSYDCRQVQFSRDYPAKQPGENVYANFVLKGATPGHYGGVPS